eukprot:TRINITY_DN15449_c0_g1_i2.p1 TRINITY_DN15449_c0_g1~~TRINITY_DN15449_c0_g1_i2.p1  ORF type:complete len:100 (-),score=8.00 TRINITY_DN15449_c0_g1_i2:86-385(-)
MEHIELKCNIRKIISGGQTGADRGGLIAGKNLGIQTGGYMPKGFKCDDDDGARVQQEFGMLESHGGYKSRDVLNVNDCDAMIAFLLDMPKTGWGMPTKM